MEENLLLSFIVPVYNAAEFLPGCLNSMIEQEIDKSKYEIVCVDDGSTDNSLEVLNAYAKKYPCVKPYHKENNGVSATRNYAIEKAQGKYLMFVDSDDFICKNSIAPILEEAIRHNADLVRWNFQNVWTGYCSEEMKKPSFEERLITTKNVPNSLWTSMVKRSIIVNNNLKFCELIHYGEDSLMSFFIHLYSLGGKLLVTDSRVYNYRILENSLSSRNTVDGVESRKKRIKNMLVRIAECEKIDRSTLTLEQNKALNARITDFVAHITKSALRIDKESFNKEIENLKKKKLYPYNPFIILGKVDSQNSALTYKNKKGYFKILLKVKLKSIAYNALTILLSYEPFLKLFRAIISRK